MNDDVNEKGYPADVQVERMRKAVVSEIGRTAERQVHDRIFKNAGPVGSVTSQPMVFATVRAALDEIEKRLQGVAMASEEVLRFHAHPEPVPDGPMTFPGDRPDGTVWEDLATRCVLLSRSIETLERNLKMTLETLR